MTIHSKNYRNYIGFRSNLTKEHFFKTIQSDKVEESNEHLIKKKKLFINKIGTIIIQRFKKRKYIFHNR